MYIYACIIQLLLEIIFYETTECIIMNFVIPNLVAKEVHLVIYQLKRIVQKLCSNSLGREINHAILDAPSYLFLSTYDFFKIYLFILLS